MAMPPPPPPPPGPPAHPDPLDYRAGSQARQDYVTQSLPRSPATWGVLLMVWLVGLAVWAGYVILIALLVYRFLSNGARY